MKNTNDNLLDAKSELDILIIAVKEGWMSDEKVIEKLRSITLTLENAIKENITLKHQLLMIGGNLI